MKTTKVAVAFFVIIAFISCKKNNDKKASCRIVTISQTSPNVNSIYNITYNNDGRISTSNESGNGGANKVFTYNGNTVIAIATRPDGSFSVRDSMTLDAKRRPLNIRTFSNEAGTNWTNSRFEYNGSDLQKIITTEESNNPAETSVATYADGNMVSLATNSSTTTLEYFTDKKVQQGDYLEVASFIQYGVSVYPHKNLVKTIASAGTILNFNYEFNPDGTISRVTATTGGTVATLSYQYQCN
jgi:hypothetical protein